MASTEPTSAALDEDRERTDENLQVERTRADGLLAAAGDPVPVPGHDRAQAQASETLETERERVNQALTDAQRRDEPSPLERTVVEAVAAERDAADDRLTVERRRNDELLRLERERSEVDDRTLERERLTTDQSLVDERHTTDEVIQAHASRLQIVSHDLRNPLQSIAYNVALLQQLATSIDPARGADVLQAAEEIDWAAKAMGRLITDLLTSTSLELGRLPLRVEHQDVAPLLAEVMKSLEPLAAAKRLRFRSRRAVSSVQVLCDAGRLAQVLSNVIGNAIKFTPEGGAVDVEVAPAGLDVLFMVRDSGPGIAAGDAPHVFERHFKGAHEHPGVGLGLFIAKALVDAQGGRIWCENRPDGPGAVFSFTLPGR